MNELSLGNRSASEYWISLAHNPQSLARLLRYLRTASRDPETGDPTVLTLEGVIWQGGVFTTKNVCPPYTPAPQKPLAKIETVINDELLTVAEVNPWKPGQWSEMRRLLYGAQTLLVSYDLPEVALTHDLWRVRVGTSHDIGVLFAGRWLDHTRDRVLLAQLTPAALRAHLEQVLNATLPL